MIDAFRPSPEGRYDDGVVLVERVAGVPLGLDEVSGRPRLRHDLGVGAVDNDLAGLLADAGVATEHFERLFTGVVLTSAGDPLTGWAGFYATTLNRLTGPSAGVGSIDEFAPIYRRAAALVRGRRVLDVASCFGFLPMLLASDDYDVIASDINDGSMRLLSTVDQRLGGRLACLRCAAQALPLPDRAVDTVFVVHLLEHLQHETGRRVLAEASRVAHRRVVVAVPYEEEPTAAYGHVRTVTRDDLVTYGEVTGWSFDVLDADGGWLILDRP